MNNFGKNLALWIVIGLLLVALFNLFQTSSSRGPQSTLPFSDFLNDVNRGQVSDVTIRGNISVAISPIAERFLLTRRMTPTLLIG